MSMKKILIVEDESLVGHHLKLILTAAGYKVTGISESVNEALAAIEEQKPDLVLLDIHLKGVLNGIDLARKLTERNMAFVYLTANFRSGSLSSHSGRMISLQRSMLRSIAIKIVLNPAVSRKWN